VATKVWNPGATPNPSSWTKGGSDWLWIWTLTPASNVVSSGRRRGQVSGLWWAGWCPPAWARLSLCEKLYLVNLCCSKAGGKQLGGLHLDDQNSGHQGRKAISSVCHEHSTPRTQPKSPLLPVGTRSISRLPVLTLLPTPRAHPPCNADSRFLQLGLYFQAAETRR